MQWQSFDDNNQQGVYRELFNVNIFVKRTATHCKIHQHFFIGLIDSLKGKYFFLQSSEEAYY